MYLCLCVIALQMELKECRLRLAEERRARLKAESRLMEVRMVSKIEASVVSFLFPCTGVTSLLISPSFERSCQSQNFML